MEYLLSDTAQTYFANTTMEYPLIDDVEAGANLPPLSSLEPPDVELGNLTDSRGTLALLREVGIIS